jgi:protein involved in polysaccharide export with SLBB domain
MRLLTYIFFISILWVAVGLWGCADMTAPAPASNTTSVAASNPIAASNPVALSNKAAPQLDAGYRVGPGDKVRITVYGEKDLSNDYDIDGSGNLSFPLIGTVKVGGLTLSQLESTLAVRLSKKYLRDPQISIDVLNYRPFYILGEVNHPGSYPYVSGMTVLNAIALAGGFTPRANDGAITVLHQNEPENSEAKIGGTALVLPGDTIKVPIRFW